MCFSQLWTLALVFDVNSDHKYSSLLLSLSILQVGVKLLLWLTAKRLRLLLLVTLLVYKLICFLYLLRSFIIFDSIHRYLGSISAHHSIGSNFL